MLWVRQAVDETQFKEALIQVGANERCKDFYPYHLPGICKLKQQDTTSQSFP